MISTVLSVEPVSTMQYSLMKGRTESKHRLMTLDSFFTIMQRVSDCRWSCSMSFISFIPRNISFELPEPQRKSRPSPQFPRFLTGFLENSQRNDLINGNPKLPMQGTFLEMYLLNPPFGFACTGHSTP
jgi:hypothetical protein